jgi:hypothetical protein
MMPLMDPGVQRHDWLPNHGKYNRIDGSPIQAKI